ncbi:MAG: hypothetical protein U0452_00225 [Anaerolineae bacterium]
MNAKKLGGALVLSTMLTVGAVAVSADPTNQQGRGGLSGRERPVVAAAIEAAADETGLGTAELIAELRSGNTLADLVTEAGGDVQSVIDAAVAVGQAQIDEALANGRITEEQATNLSQNLVQGVTSAVNGETGLRWMGRGMLRLAGARELVHAVADETGLSPHEVVQQWRNGTSLSEIATANGAIPEAIVQTVTANAIERIHQAVANGRMTQTEADLILQSLSQRITEAMNRVHEPAVPAQNGVGV